ncbi:hypothetical protein [Bombella saccharophila]|uniref:Uncharacterized protein n=1 Tax=Bombella saccharophila TaxID=2967338 RepID=A0ABT3W5S6_9PROT|nr:hypothetical protein [Bombella saccharophila]MCX5614424.1 hypothetical protein [Bombella saccharophila]
MANQLKTSENSQFLAMIRGGQIEYSPVLVEAIRAQDDAPDASRLPYLPRAVVAEARQTAEAMEAKYLAAPEPEELRDFLVKLHQSLNAIAVKPLDQETLGLRIAAAQMALEDSPCCAFGDGFARACFKRFKWMPTPAELLELAEERAAEWKRKISKVRLIVTHDNGKRFTLGYAPPPEDDATEPLQLTSEQSDQLQRQLSSTLSRFKSKRTAME